MSVVLAVVALLLAEAQGTDSELRPASANQALGELLEFARPPEQVWLTTKSESSLNEAPGIVAVIDEQSRNAWGHRGSTDSLRGVPGFYIVDDHELINVALRGVSGGAFASSSLVKVLINGWSSDAFRSTGANWLGPEWVPMSGVKRIELMRGPASSLFGSDAFLGAINLVSKTGSDFSRNAVPSNILMGGGVFGLNPRSFDVDGAVGGEYNDLEYMMSARLVGDDRSGLAIAATSPGPQIPLYNAQRQTASELQGIGTSVLGNLKYRLGEGSYIEVTPRLSWVNRGVEFGPLAQLTHGIDEQDQARGSQLGRIKTLLGSHLALALAPGLSLDAALTGAWGSTLPNDRIETGGAFYAQRSYGYTAFDGNAEVRWSVLEDLTLRAGFELNVDNEQLPAVKTRFAHSTRLGSPGTLVRELSTLQRTKLFTNVGLVAEAAWRLPAWRLRLVADARLDRHSIYANQPSGRVAVVAPLTDEFALKLLYGTAFKAPSPFLLYAVPVKVGDVVGNSTLQPQTVQTVEAEARFDMKDIWSASLVLSASRLSHLASFITKGINQIARNVGSTDVLSLEFASKGRTDFGGFGYLMGTYTWGQRRVGERGYIGQLLGRDLEAFPNALASAGLGYEHPGSHLQGTFEVAYTGSLRASDSNIITAARIYRLPAYAVLNASLALLKFSSPIGAASVRIAASNLFGTVAAVPGYGGIDYPLAARSIMIYLSQG